MMTLASLFDGSGGFPLAARQCGIVPLWSSEIAKYPLAVTGARLPEVDQMGDIRLLKGYDVPPVDIVTLGSPCQDVSNSGLQRGLSGSRSSLFFEALRLLKEMRDAYGRPSWVVFENVMGILSSCHGDDFRMVLEGLLDLSKRPGSDGICRIKDQNKKSEDAFCEGMDTISLPPERKWHRNGLILAEDASLAWSVLDAKRFGVPQSRRRVFIVADLTGQRAGKVLFDPAESFGPPVPDPVAEYPDSFAASGMDPDEGRDAAERFVRLNNHAMKHQQGHLNIWPGISQCLCAGTKASGQYMSYTVVKEKDGMKIRRLTPDEYRRLQGFPEDWEAGVKGSDSQRYDMWANGVALPCVRHILRRIRMIEERRDEDGLEQDHPAE